MTERVRCVGRRYLTPETNYFMAAHAGNWHFPFARPVRQAQAFPRFLAVAGWGTRHMGLHYVLAQVMATALVVPMTFRINRAWTFK